jgi:SAM-dependent methyltransferase
MSLTRHKKLWDDLGSADPLWAILTDPSRRGGRWELEEFFATGRHDIGIALAVGDSLGLPKKRERALDFGCGVGRLTRALAEHFESSTGVDVSTPMIEQARELNRDQGERCTFLVNASEDLRVFEDESFDLVYSRLVLQHMPNPGMIRSYLREFGRVLRPGGLLAVQLPTKIGLRQRIQSHRRVYGILRGLGLSSDYLINRLRLSPMALTPLPEDAVREELASRGLTVLRAQVDDNAGGGMVSRTYYATKGAT